MTEIIFSHHIIPCCCYSLRMMQVGKTIYLNDFGEIMKNVSKDEEKNSFSILLSSDLSYT